MFKVVSGVRLPPPKHPRTGTSKYPFASLAVGDSFYVPDYIGIKRNAVRQAVKTAHQRYPGRFFCSRQDSYGIRVYRTRKDQRL